MGCPKNTGKMVACGVGFMMLFIAYNTLQNLTTQLFEELRFKQFGFYTLAIVYISFCLASLLSGPFLRLLGSRMLMALAAGILCSFVAMFVLLGLCITIPTVSSSAACNPDFITAVFMATSLMAGVSLGWVWLGEGTYLSECVADNSGEVLQGIFWLLFQCSQVVGNLFAFFILTSPLMQLIFFCTLLLVAMGSVVVFACLHPAQPREPLSGSFLAISARSPALSPALAVADTTNGISTANVAISKGRHKHTKASTKSLLVSLKAVFRALVYRKLACFHIYCMYSGLVLSYFSGVLPLLIKDKLRSEGESNDLYINKITSAVLAVFGVANGVGGFVSGKTAHRIGGPKAMLLILFFSLVAVGYTFLVTTFADFGFLWFILGLVWGFAGGSVNPIILGIFANHFPGWSEPFGIFNFLKTLAAFCGYIIAAQLRNLPPYVFLLIVLGCSTLGCATALCFPFSANVHPSPELSIQSD